MNNAALTTDAMLGQMNRIERQGSTVQWTDLGPLKRQIEATEKLLSILDAAEDRKACQNEVHPEPEHWLWGWPCWSFLTGAALFFAIHFIVGLMRG
jgi:hypothetical protein